MRSRRFPKRKPCELGSGGGSSKAATLQPNDSSTHDDFNVEEVIKQAKEGKAKSVYLSAVKSPKELPKAIIEARRYLNDAEIAKGEGNESGFLAALTGFHSSLREFMTPGGQEDHPNPSFQLCMMQGLGFFSEERYTTAFHQFELAERYYATTQNELYRSRKNQGVCLFRMEDFQAARNIALSLFMEEPSEGVFVNLLLALDANGESEKVEKFLEAAPQFCDLQGGVAAYHFQNDSYCEALHSYKSYQDVIKPILSTQ